MRMFTKNTGKKTQDKLIKEKLTNADWNLLSQIVSMQLLVVKY